jgi:hypothetical protein
MFRGGSGLRVDAGEVPGPLAVCLVRRVLVEADPHVDRILLADDVEPGQQIRQ